LPAWESPAARLYDALVALAAVEHAAELATREIRTIATYEVVGARTAVAG
jgi:hypothetical protein